MIWSATVIAAAVVIWTAVFLHRRTTDTLGWATALVAAFAVLSIDNIISARPFSAWVTGFCLSWLLRWWVLVLARRINELADQRGVT